MKDSCTAPHQNYLCALIKGSHKFYSAGLSGSRFCGPPAPAEKGCDFWALYFKELTCRGLGYMGYQWCKYQRYCALTLTILLCLGLAL